MKQDKYHLSAVETKALTALLHKRFAQYPERHKGINWSAVEKKLEAAPEKLYSLQMMEDSGGEPDVVAYDKQRDTYTFFDCSAESPKGRRSLCYDRTALDARKEHKPKNSAMDLAAEMGVHILSEGEYRQLQELGAFDLKTSSWVQTPEAIRQLGGAVFCDRRYDTVFLYHNGAESYYAARGFRASLTI